MTQPGQIRHLKLINIIAIEDEMAEKSSSALGFELVTLHSAMLLHCCLAFFWLISNAAPWYSWWVVGVPEGVAIFMAGVRTWPIQWNIHPNNTGPTAGITACRYRAQLLLVSVLEWFASMLVRSWQSSLRCSNFIKYLNGCISGFKHSIETKEKKSVRTFLPLIDFPHQPFFALKCISWKNSRKNKFFSKPLLLNFPMLVVRKCSVVVRPPSSQLEGWEIASL